MSKMYRTAMGKAIDMDRLRLSNEETIAVGNMKVNARGDELGHGGQVVKSRNEVMNDYYRLRTPVMMPETKKPALDEAQLHAQSVAAETQRRNLRGNLADQVIRNHQQALEDSEGTE